MLPLNNQPGRFGDRRFRTRPLRVPRRHLLDPRGTGAEPAQPRVPDQRCAHDASPRDDAATASSSATAGTPAATRSTSQDRRLHYVNNLLGAQITTVSASVELPAGEVLVRATFTPTGRFRGDIELWYGDVPVGRGHIPGTTPLTYGIDPFCVGYQRMTPIAPGLSGPFPFAEGTLNQVVIDVLGEPHRDQVAEARAAEALQ